MRGQFAVNPARPVRPATGDPLRHSGAPAALQIPWAGYGHPNPWKPCRSNARDLRKPRHQPDPSHRSASRVTPTAVSSSGSRRRIAMPTSRSAPSPVGAGIPKGRDGFSRREKRSRSPWPDASPAPASRPRARTRRCLPTRTRSHPPHGPRPQRILPNLGVPRGPRPAMPPPRPDRRLSILEPGPGRPPRTTVPPPGSRPLTTIPRRGGRLAELAPRFTRPRPPPVPPMASAPLLDFRPRVWRCSSA
jgi:hypothetical protein